MLSTWYFQLGCFKLSRISFQRFGMYSTFWSPNPHHCIRTALIRSTVFQYITLREICVHIVRRILGEGAAIQIAVNTIESVDRTKGNIVYKQFIVGRTFAQIEIQEKLRLHALSIFNCTGLNGTIARHDTSSSIIIIGIFFSSVIVWPIWWWIRRCCSTWWGSETHIGLCEKTQQKLVKTKERREKKTNKTKKFGAEKKKKKLWRQRREINPIDRRLCNNFFSSFSFSSERKRLSNIRYVIIGEDPILWSLCFDIGKKYCASEKYPIIIIIANWRRRE